MLLSVPIVLLCAGFQPCSAPVAPAPLRLAIGQLPLPSATQQPEVMGTQPPPLRMRGPSPPWRVVSMLVFGFAGAYAGAHIGAAAAGNEGDSRGLIGAIYGMPIGAVVGGTIGWKLAR